MLAESAKAEAAAGQPLPESDDDDDVAGSDGELEGVLGVARKGSPAKANFSSPGGAPRPGENGDAGGRKPDQAPAAGGWDLGFLKQNQVCLVRPFTWRFSSKNTDKIMGELMQRFTRLVREILQERAAVMWVLSSQTTCQNPDCRMCPLEWQPAHSMCFMS